MGKEEEVELVSQTKKEKKQSLLEKFDIPIEHISYEYIGECRNVKELERIIRILRSGEEGVFPHLTQFTENRLGEVNPENPLLRKAKPVLTKSLLAPAERRELENELGDWMREMRVRERDLVEERHNNERLPLPQPAVREITDCKQQKFPNSQRLIKEKRISSCDYSGWDKYDADTELSRIDIIDEQEKLQAKRFQEQRRIELEKTKKETIIEKSLLTSTELSIMATREREKGNEAFHAGDYEEALRLYSSSIGMDCDVNAYNNRAMTHIKLKNYDKAIKDCNAVLEVDCINIKALLRRGLALEQLNKTNEALKDYEDVLKIDPTNKIAISSVNKLKKLDESKNVRLTIEEIYDDN